MSAVNIYYKNIPLKSEDIDLLKTQFLSFGTILGLAFEFSKKEFDRLFLRPFLSKIVYVFIPLFSILSSFCIIVIGKSFDKDKFLNSIETITSKSSTDELNNYTNWITEHYGISFLILLIALVAFLVFLTLLNYRNLYLFNNKDIPSIWKTTRAFYIPFFRILTIGVIYSFAGGVLDMLISDTSFASLLKNIFMLLFYGLFGLYHYFIIFENSSINDSLIKSFTYSKPYFWDNILRWFLFSLVIFITYLALILATTIWFIPLIISNYSILSMFILLFMSIVGIACALVVNYVYEVFGYLSFLNLTLLHENNTRAISNK